MGTKESAKERTRIKIEEPKKYRVIMHNDDFTTMDFVVEVLTEIFRKSPQEAERIMLFVHQKGKAVVGTYPYDMAVTRAEKAMARARAEGFPFLVTVEDAG